MEKGKQDIGMEGEKTQGRGEREVGRGRKENKI